jgi:ribosome-associated protein
MSDVPDLGELPDDGAGSDLAVLAARVADEKKATDVVVLDVGEVLSIAGYFVIASASNTRLARTVVESIEEVAKERLDRSPIRSEGLREQQWMLMDYGDVIVHVFIEELREFYDIERLYRDAGRLDWRLPASSDEPR